VIRIKISLGVVINYTVTYTRVTQRGAARRGAVHGQPAAKIRAYTDGAQIVQIDRERV